MTAIFFFGLINQIREERTMVGMKGTSLHAFGRLGTAIVVLIAIALGTCQVFAQTSTATIVGSVRDTTGALLPGVSITVKHTDSGLTRSIVSNENGAFTAPLLPVGASAINSMTTSFTTAVRR